MKLYDETVSRDIPATWEGADKDSVDVYQLRAELYRLHEAGQAFSRGWTVYLRVLTYKIWAGPPTRGAKVRVHTYTTTTGDDARWIRKLIQTIDAFKGV